MTNYVELEMQLELGLEDPLGPTEATKEMEAAAAHYTKTRQALRAVITSDKEKRHG